MLSHFFRLALILVLPSCLAACSTPQAASSQKSEVLAQMDNVPKAASASTEPKQLTAQDVKIAEQKSYEVAIKQLQMIPKEHPPRTQQDVEALLHHRDQVITMLQSCTTWARQENTENPKALTQRDYNYLITYFSIYPKSLKYTLMHKVSEEKRLVYFPCGGGAYQSPSVLFLHIETAGKPLLRPLKLIYFDQDTRTGQFFERHPIKTIVFDGIVIFDKEDSQRFSVLYKGRGIGDCGIIWFYKVVNNDFVLEKVKAHSKCDLKVTPSEYPQVYP